MDTTPQNEVHAMAGLLPGDYFIYALEIDGQRIFSYGLLRSIDGETFRADFRCVKPRSQPLTIPKESHQFVGRISEEAYELARLRGWPNSQTAVSALIDFSAGKKQTRVHHMTGIFPGDYLISEFEIDGESVFAYGLLRSIDGDNYHAFYQSAKPPSRPLTISGGSHRVVGRISRRAYELARLRGWPNSQTAVSDLIDFSAGKKIPLSFSERFSLPFAR